MVLSLKFLVHNLCNNIMHIHTYTSTFFYKAKTYDGNLDNEHHIGFSLDGTDGWWYIHVYTRWQGQVSYGGSLEDCIPEED